MKKSTKTLIGAGFLILVSFFTFVLYQRQKQTSFFSSEDILVVKWEVLHQLDYKSGTIPDVLKKIDGKMVKIPGFLVPLSDNYNVLNEFLLVPDPQSCIHVPPPPPNLIVHVHLKEPIPSEEAFNPAWIIGRLKIETTESEYGSASYKMQADKLEKFNYEEYDQYQNGK